MKVNKFTPYWLGLLITGLVAVVFFAGAFVGAGTAPPAPKPVTISERYVPNACAIALNLADERQATVDVIVQMAVDEQAIPGGTKPDGATLTNARSSQVEVAALTAKYQVARDECVK
jgi:hypothetical protein